MKVIPSLALFIALISLVSCGATEAQRKYQSDVSVTHQALHSVKSCLDLISKSGKYGPLTKHMSIMSAQASVLQLADRSYISKRDIPLIAEYEHDIGNCEGDFASNMSLVNPEIGSIISQGHQLQKSNAAILVEDKESWGKFVGIRQNIASKTQQLVIQIADQTTNKLNLENQRELSEKQQAWENFSRSIQEQELINHENQPITTNCNKFANSISCTTN